MILSEKREIPTSRYADLAKHDHIYVVNSFKKSSSKTILSPVIGDIMSLYLPQHEFAAISDTHGKPRFFLHGSEILFVSLAHTHDILLVALSAHGDIGIDVEIIRERRYAKHVAARYFDEMPQNLDDFYRGWTAREAFIKAIGSRISMSLSRIKTKRDNQQFKIGLTTNYSHQVCFFSPRDHFVAALCRPDNQQKEFLVMHRAQTRCSARIHCAA